MYLEIPLLKDVNARPQTWLIEGILPEGAVIMLSGDGGSGKSTLATAWAGYVSAGASFCGRETQRRDVLILDRENPVPVLTERLRRLCMDDGPGLKLWGGWMPQEAPVPGSGWVLSWVRSTEPRPLLIVDSVIAFLDGDENSSVDVRRFMHQLREVTQVGGTVLVLHHSGKAASSSDFRGSSDFKNSIDCGYLLTNLGDPARFERVGLRAFKQRIQVEPNLTLEFDASDGTFTELARGSGLTHETLVGILANEPGIGASEFELKAKACSVGQRTFRKWLNAQVRAGLVEESRGSRNRLAYSLKGRFADAVN